MYCHCPFILDLNNPITDSDCVHWVGLFGVEIQSCAATPYLIHNDAPSGTLWLMWYVQPVDIPMCYTSWNTSAMIDGCMSHAVGMLNDYMSKENIQVRWLGTLGPFLVVGAHNRATTLLLFGIVQQHLRAVFLVQVDAPPGATIVSCSTLIVFTDVSMSDLPKISFALRFHPICCGLVV